MLPSHALLASRMFSLIPHSASASFLNAPTVSSFLALYEPRMRASCEVGVFSGGRPLTNSSVCATGAKLDNVVSLTGGLGFDDGYLRLRRLAQNGTASQTLTLSIAGHRIGPASAFNGTVAFYAPRIYLDGATYNDITHIEKTLRQQQRRRERIPGRNDDDRAFGHQRILLRRVVARHLRNRRPDADEHRNRASRWPCRYGVQQECFVNSIGGTGIFWNGGGAIHAPPSGSIASLTQSTNTRPSTPPSTHPPRIPWCAHAFLPHRTP